jgi:assimilatory nitrate reductase catalytic subunit
MTNLEGRVLLRRQVKQPPAGVWTDTQILQALAERLGCGDHFASDAPGIFAEFRRATAGGAADYAGITYDRIAANDGMFWPCPDEQHAGTPRMFLDRFATPDGRAKFHPVEHRDPAEKPNRDYPYTLTTGRVLVHYQSGAQTRRVTELNAAEPEPFVEMHTETARTLGIAAGDFVRLTTPRGGAVLRARMTRDIRLDTFFVPFHWGGLGSANRLTIAARDPISRIPEFKVCAVQAKRVAPDADRDALVDTETI